MFYAGCPPTLSPPFTLCRVNILDIFVAAMRTLDSGFEDWIEMLPLLLSGCMTLSMLFTCQSSVPPSIKWRQLWQLCHWVKAD